MRVSCVPVAALPCTSPLISRGQNLSRLDLATDLYRLATAVRRIGCGYRSDPEAIAIQKDEIARKLAVLAREVAP